MLYSLEIIEVILVRDLPQKTTKQWVVDFIDKGGLLELQDQLKEALKRSERSPTKENKEIVVLLLKLVQKFVSSVTVKIELPKQEEKSAAEADKEPKDENGPIDTEEKDQKKQAPEEKKKTETTDILFHLRNAVGEIGKQIQE